MDILVMLMDGLLKWDLMLGDHPMSLCPKVRINCSLCLKVSRNGIQVSQDYGDGISRVPGLWVVPGLAATERNTLQIASMRRI
jgi:hypothetical protein